MENIHDGASPGGNSNAFNPEPVLNCAILNDLIAFQLKNNPALEKKTKADIARACDISESTLKNLLSGKNDNPHVGTLKQIIRYIGGGSIDRMVGLAPPRDFRSEEAAYDANLVQAIQIRLDEKRALIDDLQNQLAMSELEKERLRNILLEKSEGKSKACAEVDALKEAIADCKIKISLRDKWIRNRNAAIIFLAGVIGVLFAVLLFVVL